MSKPDESKPSIRFSTDVSEAAFILCIFVTIWLTGGDPDLLDALIHWLMRA